MIENLKNNMILKIVIIIIIFALLIYGIFDCGRKTYFIINTLSSNKKVSINASIARWKFDYEVKCSNVNQY